MLGFITAPAPLCITCASKPVAAPAIVDLSAVSVPGLSNAFVTAAPAYSVPVPMFSLNAVRTALAAAA